MELRKADAGTPSDAEEGAAGKEPAAEEPFFVSPFRERVLYAGCMVQIVGLSVVIVALLILEYNKEREKCQCQV